MRNLYKVLTEKEAEFDSLQQEIEVLRFVAPMLTEDLSASVTPASAILAERHSSEAEDVSTHVSVVDSAITPGADDLAEKIRALRVHAAADEPKLGRLRRIVTSIARQ
jgi:hypothetical protein